MKKLLITGGSGFIGRNLVESFRARYEVFAPSHSELELTDADAVERYIRTHAIEGIVNCANIGGNRAASTARDTVRINLRIFFNLVRAARSKLKIVHLGSGAEYDKRFPIENISEQAFDQRVPIDDYGYAKYLCSKYVQATCEPIVVLRLFGVFGKYENYKIRFISNAIAKNLLGLQITISQNIYFDFLSVVDLPPIIEYVLEHRTRERTYNVTSGSRIDLLSIVEMINSIAQHSSTVRVLHEGFNNEYSGDNTLLKNEIDHLTVTPLATAISDLYHYYQQNISIFDKNVIARDEHLKHCTVRIL